MTDFLELCPQKIQSAFFLRRGVHEAEVAYAVFDPEKMEAIATIHTDNEDKQGMVCEVVKTGYFYEPSDRVIRYTQVVVYTTD